MARFNSPLSHVRIAAPCPADWEQMIGNERVRFCAQCSLNVYNLSAMSKREAEAFISSNEGRLCVRYYRREDGSILTKNCPLGLKAIRQRMSRVAQAVSTAVLTFLAGLGIFGLTRLRYVPEHTMGTIALRPEPVLSVDTPTLGRAVKGQLVYEPLKDRPARSRRKWGHASYK
jgi:hypothetical protein